MFSGDSACERSFKNAKQILGTIITWKFDELPYLDTSEKIFEQIIMSYEAGAEYIIIFNYPQIGNNPYGAMTEEHFKTLEEFWREINRLSDLEDNSKIKKADIVLVLPKNYGWGMRHPEEEFGSGDLMKKQIKYGNFLVN